MLVSVFYFILNMSITASVIGFVLVLLRSVKIVPRFGLYILWSLVSIRLVIPFSLPSGISLFNFAGNLVKKTVSLPVNRLESLTMSNSIGAADSYFPVFIVNRSLKAIFDTSAIIWAIGASIGIVSILALYLLAMKGLKKATPAGGNVYQSESVSTPLVTGMIRQRIIIPSSLSDDKALEYILMHEKVHMRRHDNFWRIISLLIACIHWFNPFIWIFLRMFLSDMEFACDAAVIKALPCDRRREYAKTLVNFGSGDKILMQAAFGQSNIKMRVLDVITYRKLTAFAAVLSSLLILVIAAVLLTNPVK